MLYELGPAPFPDEYGEDLLPLDVCKMHIRVTSNDQDELIAALRDAAIDFVEQYCMVKLGPRTGLTLSASGFPSGGERIVLPGPAAAIIAIAWKDSSGADVTGDPLTFRVGPCGELLPAIGGHWPASVGGAVTITFNAGYPADATPQALLHAARMFLGHLWLHREAVIDGGASGEVPFGVASLCGPYRRPVI